MKYFLVTLIIVCSVCITNAQMDCSRFYPFTEGSVAEITTYDKKDKVSSIVSYKVTGLSNDSGSTTASMESRITDGTGEYISDSKYDIVCENDGISVDFKSLMNNQVFFQYENMETTVSGTNIILPNNLSVGQKLPDSDLNVIVEMGISMKVSMFMTDREVIAKEKVTVGAGTFDCYVIEYSSRLKMGLEKSWKSKQWIAEGVGMVKSEDYNKRGKVTSRSELTNFIK